ncbi:MAG: PfkB family carbohydrate kinase, partial [Actinomycetota bacterium]|nr:PfkB family carbohydrate kinase [Actinomycetota bacterium]
MTTAADSPARIDARRDLTGLLDAFAGLRVLVVGDVILDAYLDGRASDLSREAPVPVVAVSGRTEAPGGAANVAVNLAALGADVRLISVVGRDDAGQRLLELVGGFGVDVAGVVATEERSTVAKRRVLAEGQMLVRFDEGMLSPLAPHLEGEVRSLLRDGVAAVDAVVVADYGSGVMTDGVIKALAATRSPGSPPIVVDAKEPRRYRRARTFACTPNFEEARAALGGL